MGVHKLKRQGQEVIYELWPSINKHAHLRSLFKALKMLIKYKPNLKTLREKT